MAKTAPTPTPPAPIRVRLLEPHEHAGRNYPAGAELTLSATRANWLIDLKRAEAITTAEGA